MMNKSALIQTLKKQAESMNIAVAKKLSFLQSDKAFENNYLQDVKYDNQPPHQDLTGEHKQNLMARLAALRGLSMPGDYILKR